MAGRMGSSREGAAGGRVLAMLKFDTISRTEALRYILRGLQMRRAEIDMHVRVLREQLDVDSAAARKDVAVKQVAMALNFTAAKNAIPAPPVLKRRFSAAARKRMSIAQRKRHARERA